MRWYWIGIWFDSIRWVVFRGYKMEWYRIGWYRMEWYGMIWDGIRWYCNWWMVLDGIYDSQWQTMMVDGGC